MVEAEMEVRPCYILAYVTLHCVLLQERFQNISSSGRSPVVLVKTGSMSYSLSTSRENYCPNMMTCLQIRIMKVDSLLLLLLSCSIVFPWTAIGQVSLSFIISQRLIKLMSNELAMPSNHPVLCRPLLLPPSVFLSIRVFSSDSVLHIRWPKYWRVSFTISPSNEYSGLISFRMDWLELLAVQGTLKSLL